MKGVLTVGFLKFLKKDKKDLDLEEGLDVPPLPPNLDEKDFGSMQMDMPDINKYKTKNETSRQKFMPAGINEDLSPEFKGDFGKIPEAEPQIEEEPEPVQEPIFQSRKEMPDEDEYQNIQDVKPNRYYEKLERDSVREEKALLQHKGAKGTVYIKIERLRGILGNISVIKSNLKTANEMMAKMDYVSLDTNKEFEKYRNNLMDLQKKLIFVDKSLFKGERR